MNKTTDFADKGDISPWAVSAVDSLCPYKLFIGSDNGKFLPKKHNNKGTGSRDYAEIYAYDRDFQVHG